MCAASRPRASLLLCLLAAAAVATTEPVTFTIVHFNDWHNRVEANHGEDHSLCDKSNPRSGCSGGVARMKRFVDQQRSQDPNMVLLNAGDDFIGTVWDTKFTSSSGYDGSQPAAFLNMLKPDAMTIGNHDFDFGANALVRYLSRLNHPALGACNVQSNGHALGGKLQKYTILYRQGVKICVFGLTTTEVAYDNTKPNKVLDPYSSGQACAAELLGQGCHVTILLSHLGYTADLRAARVIPGIDLIIGGHSHSLLWDGNAPVYEHDSSSGSSLRDKVWGPYPTWATSNNGRQVAVVQANWGSRYMGVLKVSVDTSKGSGCVTGISGWPNLLGGDGSDSPVQEDSGMLEVIKRWRYW